MILAVPLIAAWLRSKPKEAPFIWGLIGFLPFVLGPWHLTVAPFSTPMWGGYVKGWEVSILDSVAIGTLLGSRGRWPLPVLFVPLVAYLGAVAISLFQAPYFNLALSYFIQLVRIFFVFVAVSRVVMDERGEKAVLAGLIVGVTVQAVYAIWARAGGALQTGGSLGHQNLLGFVSHMVLMPAFAVFLSGRWQRLSLLGMLAGLTVVTLTASRATIAFSAIGLALTLVMTVAVRFTGRKAMLGIVSIILLACSYPLVNSTLDRRFQSQGTSFFGQDKEREAFKIAAHAMLDARPMGVGPNHYVYVANAEGYSARAGVAWRSESRSTNVHNSYLLVAVESGYPGLITLLVLIGSALWYAFSTAIRFRHRANTEILIGLGCGIFAMSLHGLYEWMFVVYPSQYLFATSLGLICGLRSRYLRTLLAGLRGKRSARKSTFANKITASGSSPKTVPL